MGIEIERKFLIKDISLIKGLTPTYYCQGYFPTMNRTTLRVRIGGNKAHICVKSAVINISRNEYEYEIPLNDAKEMLHMLCKKPLIEKNRYKLQCDGLHWEIDVFQRDNKGLIIAEIELKSEELKIKLPSWVLKEVTGESRYYNSMLVQYPYSKWTKKEKGL